MSENTHPAAEQPVDPWLVERLLADSPTADDDDEQALAILFAALRAPAVPSELAGREDYLAAFAAAQTLRTATNPSRRKSMLATLLATKTVVAGVALVACAGTAAAAYTGSLPDTLQDVAHQSVGAPAPDATHKASPDSARPTASEAPSATPKPKKSAKGPDATGSAAHGLCTAYVKGGLGAKSTARQALSDAAGGPSNIPAYCAAVLKDSPDATARRHATGKPSDHPTAKPTDKGSDRGSESDGNKPTALPTNKP